MINEVIDGVVAAIKQAYPDWPVYTDAVSQGMKQPAFSVRCIRPSQSQVVGDRYFKRHLIRIYFFPMPGNGAWQQINSVFETLLSALELINCGGDLIRGTEMEPHIEDDVGVFMIHYNFFVHRATADENSMENFDQNIQLKEDN